jgi:hypothetical protein
VVAPVLALSTTTRTMAEGMAKPMPTLPPDFEKIAVLMPVSRPCMSTSAPPELPGLIAASVWMKDCASPTPTCVRASAEMMPCVTVWPTPNGIADRQHEIADLQRVGIADLDRGEILGALQLEHGKVRARVAQQDRRLEFTLVGERDLNLGHALDDVVVGDHQPAGIDDHARTERTLHLLARQAEAAIAEEAAEERIVHERVLRPPLDAGAIDVDDRVGRLLHDRREGQGDLLARLGHLPDLGQCSARRQRCQACRDQCEPQA